MTPNEIRSATYARLNVASVTDLLSTQYGRAAIFWGRAPQATDSGSDAMFPYITISAPSNVGFNTKDNTGNNVILQIDIWSRAQDGALERLAEIASDRLDRTQWAITGFIAAEVEAMDFMDDPDGRTRRCMIRVRVISLP